MPRSAIERAMRSYKLTCERRPDDRPEEEIRADLEKALEHVAAIGFAQANQDWEQDRHKFSATVTSLSPEERQQFQRRIDINRAALIRTTDD